MHISERLEFFLSLNYKIRLDSWSELLAIGKDFLNLENRDKELAKKIADAILYHRSLMGSSKAYEGATEIDVDLCEVSTPIAKIAYGKSTALLDFLKAELYYSNYRPTRFNKEILEKEILEIEGVDEK